ncbi:hypothetical protein BSPLISOX_1487 [uncultured Gammaproteobacteria bacterium]|nr:hypothetical protein BSPLISOX_1487 [uncultured Gammaproteobacteria bacterium]
MSDNAEIRSRDVIKAIEGFEESISIISKNIYGQDCSISCNLKAPKEGSFELNYIFHFAGVIPVLFDPSIKQLPDIFSMLYDLFIKSEGKKVQKIEQNNNGSINLVGDNNNIIINDYRPCCNIGKNILKDTLNDGKLRESATKSHAPISNQSAEKVIYKNNKNEELSTVTKNNCTAFNPLVEKMTEDEKEMKLWVKGVSFDGKKWHFQDKSSEDSFSAQIQDTGFQKTILEGKPFKNGDSIIADVSIKYSDKEGKKNQYVITKVIEHIVAPTQPELTI